MKYLNYDLDPFQEKAFIAVDNGESMIVAAPTGCGKTLLAEYAVEVSMKRGQRVVYTAPIKALSNQKYRDFRKRFGDAIVGIQTGDVTINPDARLLIMTTEIFRNLILENSPRLNDVYYTVFDEIHYLDDPERGTVWEESIILAPLEIRFMCLSATVPNIAELAAWMGSVRQTGITVIEETHRPIPLRHAFYHPKFGIMDIKSIRRKYRNNAGERKRFLRHKPSSRRIVDLVLRHGHIPVLYFCFNRRACERNAEQHQQLNLLNESERAQVRSLVATLDAQYHLEGYEKLGYLESLWESGVGFHHAGILPAAKEIVERLFTAGLIKLLFCTETFALGINMPASAVIFDEVEKFDGVQFNYLMTREYNQMAGRAGRRGMDEEGFVYSQVIPEATDASQLERLLYGKNESISSRFFASYSTILNLYSRYGEGAFDIFRRSFHNFKKGVFSITKLYQKEEEQIRNRIAFLKAAGFLDAHAIVRTIVLYGSGIQIKNSFPLWVVESLRSGQRIRCVDDQLSNPTHVSDPAQAILKIFELDRSGLYHVCGRETINRYDFAVQIAGVFGLDSTLIDRIKTAQLEQPAPRPMITGFVTLKAETELGLKFMNVHEGLMLLKSELHRERKH